MHAVVEKKTSIVLGSQYGDSERPTFIDLHRGMFTIFISQ